MNSSSSDIFLVPCEDKFLLHAPLHGVTSLVNARVAEQLRTCLAARDLGGLSPLARPLGEALLHGLPSTPVVRSGHFAPSSVGLLTTNDCNLRCLYCAPDAGSGDCSHMSPEICEGALRYQAEVICREKLSRFGLNYFGGEPFVAWDLVQFSDSRGRELAAELEVPFYSTCTTNAFMSEQKARWVGRHLSFVLVSLDGPAELQNHYRPSRTGGETHKVVVRSLRVFEEAGLPYALRCSVDTDMVDHLPEIVDYFCREFKPRKINLEPLVMQGRCLQTGLQRPTAAAFVNAVVMAGKIVREHGVELKLFTAQTEHLAQSPCGVADDSFVVCPDGLVTVCYNASHRGSPHAGAYAIGEVDVIGKTVRIDQTKLEKVRTYGVENIPRCRSCFAKWHCSGGCRLFHTPPFCEQPANAMCSLTQKLTLWRILEQLRLFDQADRVSLQPEEVLCA